MEQQAMNEHSTRGVAISAEWYLLLTPYKPEVYGDRYYIPTLVSADAERYIDYPTGGAASEETALAWARRTVEERQ